MDYRVVFDISQGYQWPAFLLTALGFSGGCVLFLAYLFLTRSHKPNRNAQMLAIGLVLLFSSIFALDSFRPTYPSYREYKRILDDGRAAVVEGPITDFRPEPWQGHAPAEQFSVNGVTFEYSYFDDTQGFHTTTARGGPLRAGVHVRIHHIGNTILKLEMKP
jgi:hypothetical protein